MCRRNGGLVWTSDAAVVRFRNAVWKDRCVACRVIVGDLAIVRIAHTGLVFGGRLRRILGSVADFDTRDGKKKKVVKKRKFLLTIGRLSVNICKRSARGRNEEGVRKKFDEKRKKFLTNETFCARIKKLSDERPKARRNSGCTL